MNRWMMVVSGLLLCALSSPALAETPTELAPVKVVFVYDVGKWASARFTPGTYSDCESSGDIIEITSCSVSGSRLAWTGPDGTAVTLLFDELTYMHSPSDRSWTEYIYRGAWSLSALGIELTTPISFSVIYYDEEPARLWGQLAIKEFGVRHWHRAVYVDADR